MFKKFVPEVNIIFLEFEKKVKAVFGHSGRFFFDSKSGNPVIKRKINMRYK